MNHLAIISFPVPLSPRRKTVEFDFATFLPIRMASFIFWLSPTKDHPFPHHALPAAAAPDAPSPRPYTACFPTGQTYISEIPPSASVFQKVFSFPLAEGNDGNDTDHSPLLENRIGNIRKLSTGCALFAALAIQIRHAVHNTAALAGNQNMMKKFA